MLIKGRYDLFFIHIGRTFYIFKGIRGTGMDKEREKYLAATAKELRKTALTMIYHAKSGHPGGSFSAADIIAALICGFTSKRIYSSG